MKKLFGLLVIVAMVAFAACGNGKKADENKVDSTATVKVDSNTVKVDSNAAKTQAAPTEAAKK